MTDCTCNQLVDLACLLQHNQEHRLHALTLQWWQATCALKSNPLCCQCHQDVLSWVLHVARVPKRIVIVECAQDVNKKCERQGGCLAGWWWDWASCKGPKAQGYSSWCRCCIHYNMPLYPFHCARSKPGHHRCAAIQYALQRRCNFESWGRYVITHKFVCNGGVFTCCKTGWANVIQREVGVKCKWAHESCERRREIHDFEFFSHMPIHQEQAKRRWGIPQATGHLSLHMWRHDSQLQTMAQQGWEWVVLPSYLEDTYPMLAALIQSSLNLANEAFEWQSELELACSVAEAATFKIQNSVPFNWEDVAVATCNGGQVKSYAKHIGRFVKLYSGWACVLVCATWKSFSMALQYANGVSLYTCLSLVSLQEVMERRLFTGCQASPRSSGSHWHWARNSWSLWQRPTSAMSICSQWWEFAWLQQIWQRHLAGSLMGMQGW